MYDGVILLSGGLDSSVLLGVLLSEGKNIAALSVCYGQRHDCEIVAAREIAAYYNVHHEVLELSSLRNIMKGSSQTDLSVEVPEGHYEEESMKATVVPNRNMLLIACATSYAISLDTPYVYYAAHKGDHAIYPDCRPEFIMAMEVAMEKCHYTPLHLVAAFATKTKAEICAVGDNISVPFALTWSCYKGDEEKGHCGMCGTCVERREAFNLANVPDPTPYACSDD